MGCSVKTSAEAVRPSWQFVVAAGGLEFVIYKMMDPFYLQYLTTDHGVGLTGSQFGIFVGLSSGVSFALDYLLGDLADRVGRRLCWALSLAVYAVAMVTLPLVGTFPMLCLVAVFMGIATALASGAQQAWLYDSVGETRYKKTMSTLYVCALPFTLFGVLVGIGLGYLDSLRIPIFVASGACLLLAAFIFLFLPENRATERTDKKPGFLDGARVVARQPALLLAAIQSVIFIVPAWITSAWWITYLNDHFHFSLNDTVLAFAATSVTAAVAGLAIDKINQKNYTVLLLIPSAVIVMLWSLALVVDNAILFIAIVTLVIGFSYVKSMGLSLFENALITKDRAASLSFMNTIASLGWIIGPPLIGWLINAAGFQGLFVLAVASSAVSLVLLYVALRVGRDALHSEATP